METKSFYRIKKGRNPYSETQMTKKRNAKLIFHIRQMISIPFNCRLLHLVNVPLQRRHFQKEQRRNSETTNTVTVTVPSRRQPLPYHHIVIICVWWQIEIRGKINKIDRRTVRRILAVCCLSLQREAFNKNNN
jgi:hypothetical protein